MRITLLILLFFGILIPSSLAQESFKYDDHGKRDPFWRLVSPTGAINKYGSDYQINELSLEGIMSGANGESIAVINGQVLRNNDTIGQFVITDISSNAVVLTKDKQNFKLYLKKEE